MLAFLSVLALATGSGTLEVRVEGGPGSSGVVELLVSSVDGVGWWPGGCRSGGSCRFPDLPFGLYEVTGKLSCGGREAERTRLVWLGAAETSLLFGCEAGDTRKLACTIDLPHAEACETSLVAHPMSAQVENAAPRLREVEPARFEGRVARSPVVELSLVSDCLPHRLRYLDTSSVAELAPELPAADLRGRILAPDGAPVPVLEVVLRARDLPRPGWFLRSALVETDEEGRFALERIPPGRYWLRAGGVSLREPDSPRLFTPLSVPVEVGAGSTDLGELRFAVSRSLHGRIEGGSDRGYLYARALDGEEDWFYVGRLGPAGAFFARSLPPGALELRCHDGSRVPAAEFVLAADAADDLLVPTLSSASLRLSVRDARAERLVPFRVEVVSPRTGASWAEGPQADLRMFQSLSGLPPGEYEAEIVSWDLRQLRAKIELAAGANEITLTL